MPSLNEVVSGAAANGLRAGVGWWLRELAGLVPDSWRGRLRERLRATLWLRRDCVEIERLVDGETELHRSDAPLNRLDDESWAQLEALIHGAGAEIALAHPDMFGTSLSLPRGVRGRLRSAVALQLRDIAPVDPALLVWTVHDVKRVGERIEIGVTMALRRRIDEIQRVFEARGTPCPPITVRAHDRAVLLTPGFRGSGATPAAKTLRTAALMAGFILAAPLLTTVAASIMTARNEAVSDQLEVMLEPKRAADRRARAAERLRRSLQPLYARPAASAQLEDLAKRLPDTAHATEIERRSDGFIQLVLETADPDALRPRLLRAPLLPAIRETGQVKTDRGALRVTYVARP